MRLVNSTSEMRVFDITFGWGTVVGFKSTIENDYLLVRFDSDPSGIRWISL